MKIFDLHQDLLLHIYSREKYGQTEQTSWELLNTSPVDLLVATAFPDPQSGNQTDPEVVRLIRDDILSYNAYITAHSDNWQLVHTAQDIFSLKKKLLIHIEGLNTFSDSDTAREQLQEWYAQGLRSIGPWWNIDNALGGGTNSPAFGITPLGREIIDWIENNPCVLDLAHASRQTFFDIAAISKRPLYVSHGNADGVCPSVRNYTDTQLRMIAASGGVIGVFFANNFVVGKNKIATLADVVRHFVHIRNLIGIEHIAIGSDFGGIISGTPTFLSSAADYGNLFKSLETAGFTPTELEYITFKNAERVLQAHLQ